MVPSRDGTGTNAILRTPATIFPSRFGPNSLDLHRKEAADAGAECRVIHNDRIGLDIDEPSDLVALLEVQAVTCTHRLLKKIGIEERLRP
jgi:2-phospho-L-lactate guanylyltransferase